MSTPQFVKLDAAESTFFARELEQIRAKAYNVKYATLKGLSLVPVDTSLDPAVETVTWRSWDQVGVAQLIASYADDLPRADIKATENTTKVKSYGVSYGYNVQEIRAARREGRPLDQMKANAAKRAVDVKLDKVAQTGEASVGLLGFLNQPNALTYAVPADGTGASKTFESKTADQVARDLHGAARNIAEQTKDVEHPDTVVVPLTTYGYISTTRMSTIDSTTILEFFLKTSPYITTVESWYALEAAGAGPSKRMVVYRKDPDALQFLLPVPFEQFPPQEKGMEFITHCHARTGGVVSYYPLSMEYVDGI